MRGTISIPRTLGERLNREPAYPEVFQGNISDLSPNLEHSYSKCWDRYLALTHFQTLLQLSGSPLSLLVALVIGQHVQATAGWYAESTTKTQNQYL